MNRAVVRAAGWVGCVVAAATLAWAGDEAVARITPDVAALARAPLVPLPFPPPWVKVPSGKGSIDDINAEFARVTQKPPTIYYTGRAFVRMDRGWLRDYVRWFRKLGTALDIRYEDQEFDCDKYSRCFVAFADLLARKGGETRGSICVGWASVFNDQPFAGIAAGVAHAVVVVGTSDGLYIIEPQNGTMVPLAEYPNRDAILAVYL